MNHAKRVVQFTLCATLLLSGLSVFTEITGTTILQFRNVNLLSDLTQKDAEDNPAGLAKKNSLLATVMDASKNTAQPNAYLLPRIFTAFYDTAAPALPRLMEKLATLQSAAKGKKKKIRIAWLGDSMIEGDLITQTVRKRLQDYFGGEGAGFVKIQSLDAASRSSVTLDWGGRWRDESFKSDAHTAPLYLSGHVFFPVSGTVSVLDNTVTDSMAPLQKSLVCGQSNGTATVVCDGTSVSFTAPEMINRIVLDSSASNRTALKMEGPKLPVYGISFEGTDGIVLDNFSFRGISGVELAQMDTGLLKSMMESNPYDLIVLQYGVNLMFRPDDVSYRWFEKKMEPVLAMLRKAAPGADFLLISAGDRAFRYGGEWKTAAGMDSLIDMQARLAQKYKMAFYNLYKSMGGYGTVVRWADSSTSFANKDYIHPNHRGAEVLGNLLADAFIADLRKYKTVNTTMAVRHH